MAVNLFSRSVRWPDETFAAFYPRTLTYNLFHWVRLKKNTSQLQLQFTQQSDFSGWLWKITYSFVAHHVIITANPTEGLKCIVDLRFWISPIHVFGFFPPESQWRSRNYAVCAQSRSNLFEKFIAYFLSSKSWIIRPSFNLTCILLQSGFWKQ